MLLREKSTIKILLVLLLIFAFSPNLSRAQTEISYSSGNAVAKPETIERIVRMSIAEVLKGRSTGANLSFEIPNIDQSIAVSPSSDILREIFQVLGIQKRVAISLSSIKAAFTLPESALKIDIKKLKPNQFQVTAKWSLTKLKASSSRLAIKVPAGVFEKPFDISSAPLEIGLAPRSKPIIFELNLITNLTEEGTRIQLTRFKTNIADEGKLRPTFFLKLGKLTVEGKPLEIEINSNGQRLIANEEQIRNEFQTMEPSVLKTICDKMQVEIETRFRDISDSIEKAPPIKLAVDSTELIRKLDGKPEFQKLLQEVSIDFFISYLQYVERYKSFVAQVSSTVCIDKQCLLDLAKPSSVGTEDLTTLGKSDEVAILIYESWIQNFFHSDLFQKRIRYLSAHSDLAGINIGKSGVRIHLNPAKNSIALVLNLEIDIKKTSKEGSAFAQKLRRRFGDVIETLFGSGKVVIVPIEINGILNGIKIGADGKPSLSITTELPFKDGKVINNFNYPSNIDQMTKMVRTDLLQSLKEEIGAAIPKEISLPLGDAIKIKNFSFNLKKVTVTQNHALLVSGQMNNHKGNYE